ncbi:MAG: S8 family serine peptidase [Candidatus Altiarchaeota archaeon]
MALTVRAENGGNTPLILVALVASAMAAIYFLNPSLTGMAVSGPMRYTDILDLDVNGNVTVNASLTAAPASLRLSGYATGGDDAAVYVIDGDRRILVFNSSMLTEVKPILDENVSEIVALMNSSSDASDEVTTTLDYASGSIWDADDNGREYYYSSIDYSVKGSTFAFTPKENNLCTLWQVYSTSSGNITTVCYGSETCCLLYGLVPVQYKNWDDPYYLSYGAAIIEDKNVVGARVVYADINLKEGNSTYFVRKGGWAFKPGLFYNPKFMFENACAESCELTNISKDLILNAEVGGRTVLHLEKAEYLSNVRGSINYSMAGISDLAVSVTDKDNNPLGHYEVSQKGGNVTLLLSSKPSTNTIPYVVSSPTEAPAVGGGAKYLEEPAPQISPSEAVIYGLRRTPESINAVFDDVNDSNVATGVVALTPELEFDNMTVTLRKRGDVTMISECTEFDYLTFHCLNWVPFTVDFKENDSVVTFWAGHSGLYAGVNVSVLDYFLDYSGMTYPGSAVVDSPVSWYTRITTRYSKQLSFKVVVTAPIFAQDLRIVDDKTGETLNITDTTESGSKDRQYQSVFTGGRNYTMYYDTPGPTKKENVSYDSEDLWVKNIAVESVTEYKDVIAYSNVPKVERNRIVLFEDDGGLLYDLSNDPLYNLSLTDADSDGLVDWAGWRLPYSGNRTFRMYVDKRVSDANTTGAFIRSFINTDGSLTSEISMEPLNYLENGTWKEYDTHIIPEVTEDFDYSVADVDYATYFSSASGPLRFGVGSGYVLSTPKDANNVPALASGDTIAYLNIWNASDLIYSVGPRRLKEVIILNNDSAPRRFEFVLTLAKLQLKEEAGGYGFYDRNNVRVFGFSQPYMYDARGRRGKVSDELSWESRDYLYTMTLDEKFMKNARYPVVVDPTWSLGGGNVTLDGDSDGGSMVTDSLILPLGNNSDTVSRSFIDFNVSGIPDDASISDVRLRVNVESQMEEGCTQCSCAVNQMGDTGTYYALTSDANGLYEEIGNGTRYDLNNKCDSKGIKTFRLGARGRKDLKARLPGNIFSVGLSSLDESNPADYASLTSSSAAGGKPTLIVEWSNATLPQSIVLTSIDDILDSPLCSYDSTQRGYICSAQDITVNGTINLLESGENSSTNIYFNSTGNFTVTPEGLVNATGRVILFSGRYEVQEPDGGAVSVKADNVRIDGGIITSGGDCSSDSISLDGGDGGDVLIQSKTASVSGYITTDGGDVDLLPTEGGSGGSGGKVTITAGSWVDVNHISTKSGASNNQASKGGGQVMIHSKDSITVADVSASGSYSRYDNGGPGGDITLTASGAIHMGCANVTGGDSQTGSGGRGGIIRLNSTASDITVTCDLSASSGTSDQSVNNGGGTITVAAHKGKAEVTAGLNAYGGVDVNGGVGGSGGAITVEARDITLAQTLNVSGGDSIGGTGGGGGSIAIGYCDTLENSTISFDGSGGSGETADAADGNVMIAQNPLWCSMNNPPTISFLSPADGITSVGNFVTLSASLSDADGDQVDVSFIGGNATEERMLYNTVVSTNVSTVEEPEISGYIVEFHQPNILKERAKIMRNITEREVKTRKKGVKIYDEVLLKNEITVLKEQLPDSAALSRSRILDEQKTALRAIQDNIPTLKDGRRIKQRFISLFNGMTLNLTREEAEELRNMPQVKSVYPNYKVDATLMDSVPLIGADTVWQLWDPEDNEITGSNVTIAVIDTGVDYTHPDLGGCLGPGCKVAGGWDFVNNDSDPMDDNGHGTHTAGVAAGDGALKGVAPGATILAYKALKSDGSGSYSDVLAAIEKASDPNGDGDYSDHADIILLALGTSCGTYSQYCGPDDPLSTSVDNAADNGIVIVVAAGNGGGTGTITSPATARKAITVAASDKNDRIADFNSKGPVEWGTGVLLKPDITAPGVNICSARWDSILPGSLCLDGSHITRSGTSVAAPHVAGAAALLLQNWGDLDQTEVKSLLKSTATDLGYDILTQGQGRVNLRGIFNSTTLPPIAEIYTMNGTTGGLIQFLGTARGTDFSRYELSVADGYGADGEFTLLYTGYSEVADSVLYTWNVSELPEDGRYTLRLRAIQHDSQETDSYALAKTARGLPPALIKVTYDWTNLTDGIYHWNVNVSDGKTSTGSLQRTFTIGAGVVIQWGGGGAPTAPNVTLQTPLHMSIAPETFRILNATVADLNNDTLGVWIYAGNSSSDVTRLVYYNQTVYNDTWVNYNITALPASSTYDSDMIMLYHLDNDSKYGENDTWVYDHSGYGYNGTAMAGALPNETGKYGMAFSLNGTDSYIHIPNPGDVLKRKNMTVSAWIKPYIPSTSFPRIVDRKIEGQFSLYWNTTNNALEGHVIHGNGLSNGTGTYAPCTSIISLNEWQFVAMTWDSIILRLYHNGAECGSDTTGTGLLADSTDNIGIGRLCFGCPDISTFEFNGSIDEVAVWNRSLSADEILDLYRLKNGSYWWYVNATDGGFYTNTTKWMFTVGEAPGNANPVFGYRNIQPVEESANDSYIIDDEVGELPPCIYCVDRTLKVGKLTYSFRSLLWFNTTQIPANATLNQTILSLYLYNSSYSIKDTAYNLTNTWDESQTTWEDRQTDVQWDIEGGDYV